MTQKSLFHASLLNTTGSRRSAFPGEARIGIVHQNQTARTMLATALKGQGLNKIQAFPDLEKVTSYLEAEDLDWLWVHTGRHDPTTPHVCGLLELICRDQSLHNLRVSVLVEPNEIGLLPFLYELGALSCQVQPSSPSAYTETVQQVLKTLQKHRGDCTLASADLLSRHLSSAGDRANDARQLLFSNLARLYPNSPFAVLGDAQCQLQQGSIAEGLRALRLAKSQDLPGWQDVAQKCLSDQNALDSGFQFGIDSYLIVEPDETVHNHIEELMRPFRPKRVHRFTDGEKALRWLANKKPPDLIIQEWKIPDVSGPNFLQRLRHSSAADTPVLVVSSLVRKSDVPLLKELGVASAVPKPLIDHEFVASLTQTMTEYSDPQSARFLERRIKSLLDRGEKEKAHALFMQTEKENKLKEPSLLFLRALFHSSEGRHAAAKEHFLSSLAKGADPLGVLPVLARTLVHLRDFESAAVCYERAQLLSPKNVYRLCELAETYHEMGKTNDSQSALNRAESLDRSNPEVMMMKTRRALQSGDLKTAQDYARKLPHKEPLVSDLNNSGIAYVKTGRISLGISLYQKTLELLEPEDHDLRNRVLYNLALAQAKDGNYPTAQRTLEGFLRQTMDGTIPSSTLVEKSRALHVRLVHANATGMRITFKDHETTQAPPNESFWSRLDGTASSKVAGRAGSFKIACAPEAQPGERCCHLIFRTSLPYKSKINARELLKNRLNFSRRESIQKPVSGALGLDFEGFDQS